MKLLLIWTVHRLNNTCCIQAYKKFINHYLHFLHLYTIFSQTFHYTLLYVPLAKSTMASTIVWAVDSRQSFVKKTLWLWRWGQPPHPPVWLSCVLVHGPHSNQAPPLDWLCTCREGTGHASPPSPEYLPSPVWPSWISLPPTIENTLLHKQLFDTLSGMTSSSMNWRPRLENVS